MNPQISVIVPVYNAEKYLHRCVNSILSQSFPDFELLLIDDGSSDCSVKICDQFAKLDSRVRVMHIPNSGPARARNIGMDIAVGKYVLFIDSDDYIGPTHIEDLNRVTDSTIPLLVIQGLTKMMDNVTMDLRFNEKEYNASDMSKILEDNSVSKMGFSVCKLYDLDILNKYGIRMNQRISFGEDLMFLLDYLLYVKKVIFINKTDYFYDNTGESLSLVRPRPFISEMYTFETMMNHVNRLSLKYNFSLIDIPQTLKYNYTFLKRALQSAVYFDKMPIRTFIDKCNLISLDVFKYAREISCNLENRDYVFCHLFMSKRFILLYYIQKVYYFLISLKAKIGLVAKYN